MHYTICRNVIILTLLVFMAAQSHADDELLVRLVDDHTYDLKSGDNKIGGTGLEFLLKATADAQFFSFAEPHNVKQVPQIFTMLFEALQERHGFQYAALETGPLILERAGTKPSRGKLEEIHKLFGAFPKSFHFRTDEELQMMADIGRLSRAKITPLWGVDQMHGTLAPLDELQKLADDDATREKINTLITEVREFNKSRGRQPEFLKQDNDAFDRLHGWLQPKSGSRAAFVTNQLAVSRQIYRNYFRAVDGEPTGYESNCEREDNMKTLFMRYYRQAQSSGDPLPKVMLKSGHWHLMKGLSPGHCYTLGTFVMDLAQSNDMSSFHLMVSVVNEGKQASSIKNFPKYAPITRVGSPDAWRIVDLRPLRGYVHSGAVKGLHKDLRHWIFAYDAVLMIGGTSRGGFVTEIKRRMGRL